MGCATEPVVRIGTFPFDTIDTVVNASAPTTDVSLREKRSFSMRLKNT